MSDSYVGMFADSLVRGVSELLAQSAEFSVYWYSVEIGPRVINREVFRAGGRRVKRILNGGFGVLSNGVLLQDSAKDRAWLMAGEDVVLQRHRAVVVVPGVLDEDLHRWYWSDVGAKLVVSAVRGVDRDRYDRPWCPADGLAQVEPVLRSLVRSISGLEDNRIGSRYRVDPFRLDAAGYLHLFGDASQLAPPDLQPWAVKARTLQAAELLARRDVVKAGRSPGRRRGVSSRRSKDVAKA